MYARACIAVLEVYQFAHDAAVAECWLISQEPYLANQDLGVRTYIISLISTVQSELQYVIQYEYSLQRYSLSFSLQETLEQTEALLKRHEAFEKAAATQEERFNSLQQLTTVRALAYSYIA